MPPTIRAFYFELDTGIYVCSEEIPIKTANELLHHFHISPPVSTTKPWGPDGTYAPYGVTLSPTVPVKDWKDGEVPMYDRATSTWSMTTVATPRLYLVEQHCFYSGRQIWPERPTFSLNRLFENIPKTSDDPIQTWIDHFISKESFLYQFKGPGSIRKDLKQRLKTISEIAHDLYKKWDKNIAYATTTPLMANPFDYHLHADMLGYHIRRVLDEIASLLFVEIFQSWLKASGESIYLDEFAPLTTESNTLQSLQDDLFKRYKKDSTIAAHLSLLQRAFQGSNSKFPETIRTTNNAVKHAFHNSNSRGQLGTNFPTIVALGKPRGKHQKNGLIEYSHSLPQILTGLEDFLIDLSIRVSDLRATGDVNLKKKYLSDHHDILVYDDVY